ATTCICHGPQVQEWLPSMHAKALSDPVYLVKKQEADKATGGKLGLFCDTCHTPIGTMAGQTRTGKLSPQSREGVTCDFCHQVVGSEKHPPGDASQRLAADGTKRAQLKDAVAPTHASAFSAFHTKAEFCGACHNLKHPTTGVALDDTYDQWAQGPYASRGIVCQDCHMSPGPGEGPVVGRAGSMGPIRDNIYLMSFAGANVALGDPVRARANLTRAATLTLDVPEIVAQGEQGSVKVSVTNSGAGHRIPAGVSEIREMWLEVNAISVDGTKRALGRQQFGVVFKDAQGRYPVQLWDAVAVQSDTRIAPLDSFEASYALPMPEEERVTIEAVLNYRSFPDELAAKAGVENPVTVMASLERVVYASEQALRTARRDARRADSVLGSGGLLIPLGIAAVSIAVLLLLAAFLVRRRRRVAEQDDPFSAG
ncbi:MAG: cytochrome c family protein, partial [Coriobacteriia bacterium]|nr:cytochrome c family protein [Coriobacteriia bacterium]